MGSNRVILSMFSHRNYDGLYISGDVLLITIVMQLIFITCECKIYFNNNNNNNMFDTKTMLNYRFLDRKN